MINGYKSLKISQTLSLNKNINRLHFSLNILQFGFNTATAIRKRKFIEKLISIIKFKTKRSLLPINYQI